MKGRRGVGLPSWRRPWLPTLVTGSAVVLVTVVPAPLVLLARAVAAFCDRYPLFAPTLGRLPPLPLALVLALAAGGFLAAVGVGGAGLLATLRCDRTLRGTAVAPPDRVAGVAAALGLASRLTYVASPEPMACCYDLLRPRIAVTAGLVDRLDDEEVVAVLGHEREHLRRRDPLRSLLLAVLAAAVPVPIVPALYGRWRMRAELAADRAALAVASPSALAGALLAIVAPARLPLAVAGLTPTEARVAHLAGRPVVPLIPAGAAVASLGLAAGIGFAMVDLAAWSDVARAACPLCRWFQ